MSMAIIDGQLMNAKCFGMKMEKKKIKSNERTNNQIDNSYTIRLFSLKATN